MFESLPRFSELGLIDRLQDFSRLVAYLREGNTAFGYRAGKVELRIGQSLDSGFQGHDHAEEIFDLFRAKLEGSDYTIQRNGSVMIACNLDSARYYGEHAYLIACTLKDTQCSEKFCGAGDMAAWESYYEQIDSRVTEPGFIDLVDKIRAGDLQLARRFFPYLEDAIQNYRTTKFTPNTEILMDPSRVLIRVIRKVPNHPE